jgi:hypothetical protein
MVASGRIEYDTPLLHFQHSLNGKALPHGLGAKSQHMIVLP